MKKAQSKSAVKKKPLQASKSSKGKKRRTKEKLPFKQIEYEPEDEKTSAGRPTIFTQEIAEKICYLIATTTKGLRRICEDKSLPSKSTIYRWLNDDEEGEFRDMFARAHEMRADLLAAEILEIADNNSLDREAFVGMNHIQRDKLRIDARKFIAAKLSPKKWGERVDITSGDKALGVTVFLPDNQRPVNGEKE